MRDFAHGPNAPGKAPAADELSALHDIHCDRLPDFAKNIILDTGIHSPTPWERHEELDHGGGACQFRYLNKAFLCLQDLVDVAHLRFVVTQSVDALPDSFYGNDVIAIVLGDERCRTPAYTSKVRAVFKWYGTHETLNLPAATVSLPAALSHGVYYAAHAGVRLKDRLRGQGGRNDVVPHTAPMAIPLGYRNQVDLAIRTMADRPVDVFFAGSVTHHMGFSPHRLLPPPKELARSAMLAALERFTRQQPNAKVDVRLQDGFHASVTSSAEAYSESLMNAKICLAPQGTSLETFRFYEGMRAGSIVITEMLPPRDFYNGAPVVRIENWAKLDVALEKLLANPHDMQTMSDASVTWYQERCSPEATASIVARACANV